MDTEVYKDWYGRAYIKFNINRFVFERGCAFGYSRELCKCGVPFSTEICPTCKTKRDVKVRDAHIWSMKDIDFITLEFFANKRFDFWVTTEAYDWSKIPTHPTRFVGFMKWRNEVFKPAQETEPGFIKGKDLVFELDCAGHKRTGDDWEKGIAVTRKLVDVCRSMGIPEVWVVFSGSGGFHVWVPWVHLRKFYEASDWGSFGTELVPLSEFTKSFSADVSCSAGAALGKNKVLFLDGIEIDIAPNLRRGLIRCPYSLHPKTGNVVYALTKKEFEDLVPKDIKEKFSVAYVSTHTTLKNRGIPNVLG